MVKRPPKRAQFRQNVKMYRPLGNLCQSIEGSMLTAIMNRTLKIQCPLLLSIDEGIQKAKTFWVFKWIPFFSIFLYYYFFLREFCFTICFKVIVFFYICYLLLPYTALIRWVHYPESAKLNLKEQVMKDSA